MDLAGLPAVGLGALGLGGGPLQRGADLLGGDLHHRPPFPGGLVLPGAGAELAEHVAESLSKGDRAVVIGRLKSRSWETPEGDKRSVVEVEAEEVAPSLKFATAKVGRSAAKVAADASKGGQFNDEPPF